MRVGKSRKAKRECAIVRRAGMARRGYDQRREEVNRSHEKQRQAARNEERKHLFEFVSSRVASDGFFDRAGSRLLHRYSSHTRRSLVLSVKTKRVLEQQKSETLNFAFRSFPVESTNQRAFGYAGKRVKVKARKQQKNSDSAFLIRRTTSAGCQTHVRAFSLLVRSTQLTAGTIAPEADSASLASRDSVDFSTPLPSPALPLPLEDAPSQAECDTPTLESIPAETKEDTLDHLTPKKLPPTFPTNAALDAPAFRPSPNKRLSFISTPSPSALANSSNATNQSTVGRSGPGHARRPSRAERYDKLVERARGMLVKRPKSGGSDTRSIDSRGEKEAGLEEEEWRECVESLLMVVDGMVSHFANNDF